jgi:RimJ/RimL family protein N-acetyltransferase
MNIELKPFSFRTMLPNAREFYSRLEENRERLSPWFWWTRIDTTPNFQKTLQFMCLLILDTKCKKIAHKLSKQNLYNEQFLIYTDGSVAGMIGLEDIDHVKQCAELWYFSIIGSESKGIIKTSISLVENYAFGKKNLDYLYAKVVEHNANSNNFLQHVGYNITSIEYNVPTSKKNPDIANIITRKKQR